MRSSDWPEWHCPNHSRPLGREANRLICPEGDGFDIVDDIPRIEPRSNYDDHFGAQWNKFRGTQLESHTGRPHGEWRLHRCFGEELWSALRGKQILERGCGAGRFTEVLLARGGLVTSMDISSAVEANSANFRPVRIIGSRRALFHPPCWTRARMDHRPKRKIGPIPAITYKHSS